MDQPIYLDQTSIGGSVLLLANKRQVLSFHKPCRLRAGSGGESDARAIGRRSAAVISR
jgi:hypothetical protein